MPPGMDKACGLIDPRLCTRYNSMRRRDVTGKNGKLFCVRLVVAQITVFVLPG